jgi:hypothetical protein
MNYITILTLAAVYLVSFAGTVIVIDAGLVAGRFTEEDYRSGFHWALVPGVNTVLVILNALAWLVARLAR